MSVALTTQLGLPALDRQFNYLDTLVFHWQTWLCALCALKTCRGSKTAYYTLRSTCYSPESFVSELNDNCCHFSSCRLIHCEISTQVPSSTVFEGITKLNVTSANPHDSCFCFVCIFQLPMISHLVPVRNVERVVLNSLDILTEHLVTGDSLPEIFSFITCTKEARCAVTVVCPQSFG